jgi:cell division septal protein FtsQ
LGIAVFATWGLNVAFTLRQIEVVGDPVKLEVDKDRLAKNLVFLQTGKLEKELLDSYPLIGSVTFSKSFPSTLVVHVKLRQAYAYLLSDGHIYQLDREGIVIADFDRGDGLPRMYYNVGIRSIGSKVTDPRVLGTLLFLTNLPEGIAIESLTEKDSASIQASMGHTNIFLPQKGDLKDKAGTLQTIVMGFRIKGTLPTVIDLRFDKPIVTN